MTSSLRQAICSLSLVSLVSAGGCASIKQLAPAGTGTGSTSQSTASNPDELPKPQTVQACITTAEPLASDGHVREAVLLYEKARSLNPKAMDYSRRLAALYDMSGDLAQATAEFNAALAAAPTDADLLNDAGCFHDRKGNPAEAERLLRRAIAASPQHARAQINLGIALAHQGQFQEAFDTFVPIVGPAAAHSNIGMLLAKQGRNEEALRAFHQALALNANLPQARAAADYIQSVHSSRLASAGLQSPAAASQ